MTIQYTLAIFNFLTKNIHDHAEITNMIIRFLY